MLNNFPLINYLKTSLSPEHFWDAASAIANSFMVVATFLLLRTTLQSEKDRNRREFIEKVATPVLAHLNSVEMFLRSSPLQLERLTVENVWRWRGIRLNAGSIIYLSDKRVVSKIDDYDQRLIRFDNFLTQQIEVYASLIREDFRKNILSKFNLTFFDDDQVENLITTFPYTAECRIVIGGKRSAVSLFQLAFLNTTFKDFLKTLERDPALPNTQISYKEFMIGGQAYEKFDDEDFDGVSRRIKEQNMSNPELGEFILEYKHMSESTKSLREILQQV